jgi:hypothetical protein
VSYLGPAKRALGGSPRKEGLKYDDWLRTWKFSQGSYRAVPVTARRAKRENGGLGEDPPGSTMTGYRVRRTCKSNQAARRAKRENGTLGVLTQQVRKLANKVVRTWKFSQGSYAPRQQGLGVWGGGISHQFII